MGRAWRILGVTGRHWVHSDVSKGQEIAKGSSGLIMLRAMSWEGTPDFYSQCSGEPLEVFKQRSDMIGFAFGRDHGGRRDWEQFLLSSSTAKDDPGTRRAILHAFIDTARRCFTRVEIVL